MNSLRAKLLAPFIAGTLALTLLLAWYTYSSARKAVEDAMFLISESKTNHAASSMALLFKSMSSSLQNMVGDPHVTSLFTAQQDTGTAKTQTADWLEIITQGNEYYRDILILDKNGICISSSNPGLVGNSYADRPYVQQALSGMFTFGDSSVGLVTKRFSTVSAGPIDTQDGIVGALVLMSDFPKIVDYDTGSSHDSQTIFTALLAPNGMFMAHKDRDLMGNEEKVFPELYKELAKTGEKGGTVAFSLRGVSYVGYAKVEGTSKWVVVTSGITSEVFAPAYRVGLTVLGISLAFLAIISFMVIRFANGILTSLLSLIHYAKRVSEGDLELQLGPTRRKDELGVLHNALQRVVSSLQSMLLETQEASKMKGQFLANMSHEIRTPLNAIIGMTHLSLRGRNLPDKERDYLDKIQLAAKSLLGLINDILDLSKVEAGMLEMESTPFSLKETLENTLAIHQENAAARSIALVLEYQKDAPVYFTGDPLRIGQIVNNLVGNAIKFTHQGQVTLRCREDSQKTSGSQSVMCISVTDTGIGIAPETLRTLFQPFTQADSSISRQFGGTGLGLAISDKLVALLGGKFTVTSEVNIGTTFSFSFPLQRNEKSESEAAGDLPLDVAFEQLKLQGKRILVAEDNDINQLIMQELIAPSGASVILANNGREAVDAVTAEDFDLVFMDMQMPVMDGLEATRRIRALEKANNIPIIAVTANAMKEDKDKGFACGMNDYLTKPIEPMQLLQMLRLWLVTGKKPDNICR